MPVAAIDTNTSKYIAFYLKGYTQHRMNLRRYHGIVTEKTPFIMMQTVDSHDGMPILYRASSTALTNMYLNPLNIGDFKSIMGHNMKMLFLGVQLEDT
jgi:hypothetical protein